MQHREHADLHAGRVGQTRDASQRLAERTVNAARKQAKEIADPIRGVTVKTGRTKPETGIRSVSFSG